MRLYQSKYEWLKANPRKVHDKGVTTGAVLAPLSYENPPAVVPPSPAGNEALNTSHERKSLLFWGLPQLDEYDKKPRNRQLKLFSEAEMTNLLDRVTFNDWPLCGPDSINKP